MLGVRQPTPSTSTDSEPAWSNDFDDDGPDDPLSGNTPSGSDAGPDAVPLKLKKRPLGEVMRGALLGASEGVHNALARTEQEQAAGVWLMAESEAADIADPLASVLQRRAGSAVDVAPDINDLIAAGVALAAYVISNARKAFRIRRALRVTGVHESEENSE